MKTIKLVILAPGYMELPAPGWGAVERIVWDYYELLKNYKNTDTIKYDVLIINKPSYNLIIQEYNKIIPKPDVVHIMYDDHISVAKTIYETCKTIYYTSHFAYITHPEFSTQYKTYFNNIFKKVIDNKDYIYINAITNDVKQTYIKYGFPEHKINIIYNGARGDLFNYSIEPKNNNKSIYLGKIEIRKAQYKYQTIPNINFVGNYHNSNFNKNNNNYLGEWTKNEIYKNLSDYGNLILLSDGEADPLVVKEGLIAGLGIVVSECASANLDLSKKFINVIPNNKLNDLKYIETIINENRNYSINNREEIREYALNNFDWKNIIQNYCNICLI